MKTENEIKQEIMNHQQIAGIKILGFDSIKDLGNLATIVYCDGYIKALEWVLNLPTEEKQK